VKIAEVLWRPQTGKFLGSEQPQQQREKKQKEWRRPRHAVIRRGVDGVGKPALQTPADKTRENERILEMNKTAAALGGPNLIQATWTYNKGYRAGEGGAEKILNASRRVAADPLLEGARGQD